MKEREAVLRSDPPQADVSNRTDSITPNMSRFLELDRSHIDVIVNTISGGEENVQDIYPLTPMQEGLLFHHLLNSRIDGYVLSIGLELQSRAQLERLVSALQKVIDRHDALRSAILWEELPRPIQVVYRSATLPIHEFLLESGLNAADQLRERVSFGNHTWDLRRAPLVRLQTAVDSSSGLCYACLQVHHLVCDHASLKIIAMEAISCLRNQAQPSREAKSFGDHVTDALSAANSNSPEEFFREKLREISEPTAPFGLLDVYGDAARIIEIRQFLESTLTQRAREQAHHYGIGIARLLHSAWALVIARTSGRDDVVFGTVLSSARRRDPRLDRTIGMIANTLPLRIRLRELTARDVVLQVHHELSDLAHHEQVSLALARNCSGIEGSAPLFSALFNYRHNERYPEADWSSVPGIRVIATGEARTNYPVTMTLDDLGNDIEVTAQTDGRIDPHRIVEYLQTALQSLVEALEHAPQTPAFSLSILPESERRQVLEQFNATQAHYPKDRLIHELIEKQVERTPNAVAVGHEDRSLTYAELNRKANQLARFLRERGVGPERLVGICAERSLEMVIGLIGILKAGGAYVPLDPSYPAERLQYILTDASPIVLLTQQKLKGRLPETSAIVVTLDGGWNQIGEEESSNQDSGALHVNSQNLSYVIYTSGSTGTPKGVSIEHRNAVNLVCWASSAIPSSVFQRTLQSTSLNFDLSVYEIFVPLSVGGCIRVVENALSVASAPAEETLINTVPSVIKALLDAGGIPETTRVVNLAGEALKKELIERIFSSSLVEHVCNLYGPSETTTYSTWFPMLRDAGIRESIGSPIANTQIYILDAQQQLVPIDAVGEVYIAGEGVARGYLNRAELTAERFVPDPFSSDSQMRMYKTGDLGRWRADGTIEYLGRNDHQVKIRGFRIELGEIETYLLQHSQIKEAVIVAREDAPGEKHLVAYLTKRDQGDLRVGDLRGYVKRGLPEYMMPTAFVILESLPLTPSGKLDRRSLPVPDLTAYVSRTYEPPQGELEEIVAAIWQELLHVQQVGRQDNFFELGGHSLLSILMLERLRRVGLSAEVRQVFECPTLADFACALLNEPTLQFEVPANRIALKSTTITPEMLPLVNLESRHIELIVQSVPGGVANIKDIYPLAPLQEGILFHHLRGAGRGDTYVVPYLLSISSRERLEELISALQSTIDRHDSLRTAFLWDRLPQPVQVVYRQATLPVEELLLDRTRNSVEQVNEWIMPDRQKLDLRQAPLMRAKVAADPSSSRWYVLLQLHHIVADATSSQTVISEVVAHLEGNAEKLPEPIQYRDHVSQALAYIRLNDAEGFFRRKLGSVEEPTAPFGLLDVHIDSSQITEFQETTAPSLSRRLRAHARRLGVSAAALFHAAWALVLAHTSGREDVVFGTVLVGRLLGGLDTQRIVGMLINTLPLRLRLQNATARELIEHTQRELVELLSHEQAPLATAQRCSGIAGSVPLFSALLNYRHSSTNFELEWDRATGVRLLSAHERTNYPLTLSIDGSKDNFVLTAQTDGRVDPHRIVGYLQTALQSLVEALERAPQAPALSLLILPASERRQVLELFNATRAHYPKDKLIHELIEEQVERTPNALAVVYEGGSLTYAELNRRANQLARFLRERGVGPDRLVGICAERSLELVTGLLGILKAGGAYVPLDPSYPAERLQYMLADAAPEILLTQGRLRHRLPSVSTTIVALDDDWSQIAQHQFGNLGGDSLGLFPGHLAYVIYTSGSTGRPKGAMNEHCGIINRLWWMQSQYRLNSADRVLQKTPFSFDVSVWEFFWTLMSGASMVLARPGGHKDPSYLKKIIEESGVTTLHFVPSMLQSFLDQYRLGDCPSLQHVICSGEELSPSLHRRFFELMPQVRMSNLYGPTEAAIDVTAWECSSHHVNSRIPIGRPISNIQMYVLDQHYRLVPLGVVGELHIGGVGVGRGYLNRPELTAERFVRDPFSLDRRARMYKTGDLACWRPDGTIEYLGRNDNQVKIRGFRIELGEIEARLVQHGHVKEAVVVAREDRGEKSLVAYVIPHLSSNSRAIVGAEMWRARLKAVLPEHMIPNAFVVMERFPLSPNGKLDRRALPAPDSAAGFSEYEPPQGELEEALAATWCEILSARKVGRRDSFFDLGGHSLLVLRLLLKINDSLGAELSITDVYKSPTLMELASRISSGVSSDELINLCEEARLNDEIHVRSNVRNSKAQKVLLTGSTGFVGRFLLAQLLQDTDATVYCLIREKSSAEATTRLKAVLHKWDLWRDDFEQRIVAVAGDLRFPRLGLNDDVYRFVADEVDVIYHCATSMNHLETYAMSKAVNVDATKDLLHLAIFKKTKVINYISTLSIFSSQASDRYRFVNEETSIDYETHSTSNGYVASKWVSEKMLMLAQERGIPCNIFRLGLIWGDTKQGRYDEQQREYRILKSCLLSGYGIKNYHYNMPPTPVDYAVRAIIFLAKKYARGGRIFHVSSPNPNFDNVFEHCGDTLGVPLELKSYFEWIVEMRRLHYQGKSMPIVPLIEAEFSMDIDQFSDNQNYLNSRRTQIDCSRTNRELELSGIDAPISDDGFISIVIRAMCSRDPQIREWLAIHSCQDTEFNRSLKSALRMRLESVS